MARDPQKQLESEVSRILDECKSRILSWNNLDEGTRWSQVSSQTDQARNDIIRKIRDLWPDDIHD